MAIFIIKSWSTVVLGYWKWYRCISVSQCLITWAKQCGVHRIIPLSSEGAELGFKSAMPGDLQFIGLSSLNVNMLYKTPKYQIAYWERNYFSVWSSSGSCTLEAVVRCKFSSMAEWFIARLGRNSTTAWITTFLLLETLREHIGLSLLLHS